MEPQGVVALVTDAGGSHLTNYYEALAGTPEVAGVLLVDPSGQSETGARKGLGEKLKLVTRKSTDAWAQRPCLALVTLPAVKTPPVLKDVLEAGVSAIVEKPACIKYDDFAPLVTLAHSQHKSVWLALANRNSPSIIEARKLISRGAIGQVYGCELHFIADQTRLKAVDYRQKWVAQKSQAGGGNLAWLGIHWLDLAMFLTRSPVTRVCGFTANVGKQPLDVEDSAAMVLQFANGTLGTLTAGYYLDKGYHSHIKIWGSQGWLHLEPRLEKPLRWQSYLPGAAGDVQVYDGPLTPTGYPPFVRQCVRASLGVQEAPLTTDDSARALRTLFACYRAAESGQVQVLS